MVNSKLIFKLKKIYPNLKNSHISSIADVFFQSIAKNLLANQAIELRNFGRWSVKTTKARYNARNPKTQEIIFVPEKKKIAFKMSKHLKNEINKI